uniref:Uncharacterized protein n=1 Tax=Glossina morsitans morsitans TaxID=37546 RepID=A0A1B0G055_GLOMM
MLSDSTNEKPCQLDLFLVPEMEMEYLNFKNFSFTESKSQFISYYEQLCASTKAMCNRFVVFQRRFIFYPYNGKQSFSSLNSFLSYIVTLSIPFSFLVS